MEGTELSPHNWGLGVAFLRCIVCIRVVVCAVTPASLPQRAVCVPSLLCPGLHLKWLSESPEPYRCVFITSPACPHLFNLERVDIFLWVLRPIWCVKGTQRIKAASSAAHWIEKQFLGTDHFYKGHSVYSEGNSLKRKFVLRQSSEV